MNMVSKREITSFQLVFLLIHMQVGVGVISLPYDIFIKTKNDSWIPVLITGIVIQIMILLFGALMKRFPTNNLYGIVSVLFGKFFGNMITILYSVLYIFAGSLILTKFVFVLKTWMMPHTPKWILLSLICFTAVFIVKDNLQIIARFMVISSVVFIGFIGSATYALKYAHFSYILPVGANGIMPIIEGLPPSLFAFQGFELLLFIYPFVQSTRKSILKAASIANIFVTLFYLLLVIVSTLFFSVAEFRIVPEPVLYLIKAFSFRIIERPDLLFTAMWIVLVVTTLIGVTYIASLGLATITRAENLRNYAIFVVSIIFLGALPIDNMNTISSMGKIHDYIIVPFFYGLPIILLFVSIVLNKKEEVKR